MSFKKKVLNILVIVSLLLNTFIFAPQAQAFNLFRFLRRTVRFVVNLPHKATRWMGPVLGPLAANILTQNLIQHPNLGKIFSKAHKAERVFSKIEDVNKKLDNVKGMYREQSKLLDGQASKLRDVRAQMQDKLLHDKDYTFADYKNDVVAIDNLIKVYEAAADKFETAADRLGPKDVVKMLGEDVLKQAMGNIKQAVIFEASKELEKFINPDVITKFLGGESSGVDAVLDFFVDKQISEVFGDDQQLSEEDDSEFRDRLKQRIKDKLKEDADYFKENWEQRLNELLQEVANDMGIEAENLIKKSDEYLKGNEPDLSEIEDKPSGSSEGVPSYQCGPGYIWKPQSGTGCVQENCNDIPNAHYSYEGYCVCGSSGSMFEDPKDPNLECHYPYEYESCRSCVYACVHIDEECPDPPK